MIHHVCALYQLHIRVEENIETKHFCQIIIWFWKLIEDFSLMFLYSKCVDEVNESFEALYIFSCCWSYSSRLSVKRIITKTFLVEEKENSIDWVNIECSAMFIVYLRQQRLDRCQNSKVLRNLKESSVTFRTSNSNLSMNIS